jgi:hypothetical protein
MSRRPNTVTLLLVCAMAGVACAPLGLGRRAVEPAPVVADTTPARPAWVAPAPAAATRSDEDGLARLARFAAVWHAVRWWHPDVVERGPAWDTAYLRHVEPARAARDAAAFADAVAALLDELDDPASRVVRARAPGRDSLAAGAPHGGAPVVAGDGVRVADARADGTVARAAVLRTADSLLLVRPVALQGGDLSSLLPTVPPAVAVLDLRTDSGTVAGLPWRSRAPTAAELPRAGPAVPPLVARSVRRAAPDPAPGAPPAVDDAFAWLLHPLAAPDAPPAPDAPATTTVAPRLVVVVDDATVVPPTLLALHAAGRLQFVSTGSGVLTQQPATIILPLGGDAAAHVRLAAWDALPGRPAARRADTTLAAAGPRGLAPDTLDAALRVALALARRGAAADSVPPRDPVARLPAAARPTMAGAGAAGVSTAGAGPALPDPARRAPYPSLPERLLAVTQLWGAARAFSPYLPMADEDWDQAFADALGAAEEAGSARAWGRTVLRFAAALDASQVSVHVPDHPEFERRRGRVPLALRLVEGRPLVTAIHDSAAARTGVQVGDEIVAIGGEPIDKRFERLRPLVSASNAWSREERLRDWLLQGPAEVKATFRVRRDGAPRDVEFQYGDLVPPVVAAPGPTVDTLAGGVLRVRPDAAAAPRPSARAAAPLAPPPASARAVIVDLRGVHDAAAAAWLAGSVLDADRRAFARDERSWLEAPPTATLRAPELDPARRSTRTVRTTPSVPPDAFTGPMAILVDAATQGEGELLALRLLAGGQSRLLVGAPTAGAVGAVTELALAGDVRVTLPVGDVRHPDGRFLQRLGLTPGLGVTPTVTGVRSGRDEVLEAAQRWIAQQLAPPPARRR